MAEETFKANILFYYLKNIINNYLKNIINNYYKKLFIFQPHINKKSKKLASKYSPNSQVFYEEPKQEIDSIEVIKQKYNFFNVVQ